MSIPGLGIGLPPQHPPPPHHHHLPPPPPQHPFHHLPLIIIIIIIIISSSSSIITIILIIALILIRILILIIIIFFFFLIIIIIIIIMLIMTISIYIIVQYPFPPPYCLGSLARIIFGNVTPRETLRMPWPANLGCWQLKLIQDYPASVSQALTHVQEINRLHFCCSANFDGEIGFCHIDDDDILVPVSPRT